MQRDQMTEEQYLRAQLAEMARRYEEAIKPYITRLAALAREREGQLAAFFQEVGRFHEEAKWTSEEVRGDQFERVERTPTTDAPTVRAARCLKTVGLVEARGDYRATFCEKEEGHEGPCVYVAPTAGESRGLRHIPKEGDDFCSGAQAKAPGERSVVVVGLDAARKGVTDAFFVSLFKTLVEDKGAAGT